MTASSKNNVPVVGVAGIIRDRYEHRRVLLTRRSRDPYAGYWHLPGGRVEFGETVAATLVRELREELGVETRVIGRMPVDITQSIITSADRHVIMLFFDVVIESGTPRALDGTSELGFFSEQRAAQLSPMLDNCAAVLNRRFLWNLPRT